jgi:hypothetical protein
MTRAMYDMFPMNKNGLKTECRLGMIKASLGKGVSKQPEADFRFLFALLWPIRAHEHSTTVSPYRPAAENLTHRQTARRIFSSSRASMRVGGEGGGGSLCE